MPYPLAAVRPQSRPLDGYASLRDYTGYWKCDEASGNFLDSSSNGNNLGPSGAPGTAAGQIGTSRSFVAASSQYGIHVDAASLRRNKNWTFAFWVYHTTIPGYQIYLSKDDGSSNREFLIALNPSSQIELQCAGSSVCNTGANTLSASTWYHITVTWDNTSKAGNIYIGGVNKGNGTGASVISGTTANFLFGAYAATPTLFLNGRLDDVVMADRIWTTTEIANNAARTVALV